MGVGKSLKVVRGGACCNLKPQFTDESGPRAKESVKRPRQGRLLLGKKGTAQSQRCRSENREKREPMCPKEGPSKFVGGGGGGGGGVGGKKGQEVEGRVSTRHPLRGGEQ